MTWQMPPQPVQLSFDDELAGGTASWYEHLPVGHPLPAAGDWVWGPAEAEDGPRLPHTTHYEVVRRGWTFVSYGSANARDGRWDPIIRVHVRRVPADAVKVGVVSEP